MGKLLDKNTLLTLMKDPKSIDLHELALAKAKNVKVSPNSVHDFIADRARSKNVKNMDEAFQKLNNLAKNGTLGLWHKKYGHKYGMALKENTVINNKLDSLLEDVGAPVAAGTVASGAGPIASFGGPPSKNIINKSPLKKQKSHQDPGAVK